jgi:hypothetical protein
MGGKAGTRTKVDLTGWNLPSKRFTPETQQAGLHPFAPTKSELSNLGLLFATDTLPESVVKPSASSIKNAQRIKLPTILNGRIARPGDVAVFRIDAKAGDEIVAEVQARRLGSPLDSTLTLSDAKGNQLAFNDDFEDKATALVTHQADSQISYRFTVNGSYYLELADAQQNGGPEYAYRLRVSRPRPDFELRLSSSSVNLHPGETVAVPVVLLRRDGFAGEVALRLLDAPDGIMLRGGVIPAGVNSVRVTLTAPANALAAPHNLQLEGEALIDGAKVRHVSVPADDRMQAFSWHHLVPAHQCLVFVYGNGRNNPWKASEERLKIPRGGIVQFRIEVPPAQSKNTIQLALSDPPEGIDLLDFVQDKGSISIRFRADSKLAPGLKGNLIVEATIHKPASKDAPPNQNRVRPLGTLPAIPFEVVSQ